MGAQMDGLEKTAIAVSIIFVERNMNFSFSIELIFLLQSLPVVIIR